MGDWLRKVPPPYTNVAANLAATDAFGIKITMLSTNDPVSEWFGDDAPAVAQLIHGSLACMITRHPTRFCGLCALPLQNEEAAAAELDPCEKQLGFRGIRLHANLADDWGDEPQCHWLTPRRRRGENSPRQRTATLSTMNTPRRQTLQDKSLRSTSKAKPSIAILLFLATLTALASDAGRKHAENDLLARPAIVVTVGITSADIVGNDNRALQATVDYVGNLGGGVVEIGPGEFLMRDSLHLRSRVTVRGAGERTVLKKDREHRTPLAADGDFGEAAITVQNPEGFGIGRGVYVASKTMRNFLGACGTILNARSNYFTLNRSLNADILMSDGGFAATIYPVISGYNLEDARVENLAVDGNRTENPTKVDGCRTAGIFFYRGDNCVISNCFVRDYNGDGISFQQSNDVKVEGCVVERCAGFGLHPGSGSQRPSVKNSRAIANGEDGFFFCWRVRGGVAESNWLENNGGYGMSIGHKDSDNCVRSNTIIGNKLGGVYWRDETEPMAAHRIMFEHNTVRDNEGWGLFVDGATRGTIIRSNVVEDTGSGRQKTGVRIGKRAGEVLLEGNTLKAANPLQDERQKQ